MKFVVLHTEDPDLEFALEELFEQADEQLAPDETPVGGMVFACIDADHAQVMKALTERFPEAALIGRSTDGEVTSRARFAEDSIAVVLFISDDVTVSMGFAENVSQDTRAAARKAVDAARLPDAGEPALCIALPDCLAADGAGIVDCLRDELGESVPLTGGMAGDQWRFQRSHQFAGVRVCSDSLPLLLFYGPLRASVGVGSGYVATGKVGLVTAAEGAVVHTIDDRPAMEFFRDFFGQTVTPNPEFPLALFDNADEPHVLRAPMSYDHETGSVTFAGRIQVGNTVRITTAAHEEMLEGCERSIEMALDSFEGDPSGVLLFSCAARKQLLGTRTASEYDIAVDRLPEGIPVAGFYSYGEVGPSPGGPAKFHNETVVTLILGRAPE